MGLIGREKECEILDGLLADARQGLSRTLVLSGEVGVGKSALIDYAVQSALGFRIVRVSGVEAEEDLTFAALHRLLLTLLDGIDQLPPRQRDALSVSLGLADGVPADRSLVGLATLNLLTDAAASRPLLVCVDDAQWLDLASLRMLGFTARRLLAEGIVMVFGVRTDSALLDQLNAVEVLELSGLDERSAITLLQSVTKTPIEPRIAERVAVATQGNPLALIDLGVELSGQQLVGGTLLPEPIPLGDHLERHYLRMVKALPEATQTWLVLAAAEPSLDVRVVSAAASQLGLDTEVQEPAEAARIVDLRRGIGFRHPLIRSAIYNGATTSERNRAHLALAEVLSSPEEEHRRAWHLAEAATEPDESLARLLENAGERASGRGCFVARATYLTKAADLTPEPDLRNRRVLAAAEAAFAGGALVQAQSLLDRVDTQLDDQWASGRERILAARLALLTGEPDGFATAPEACLTAAKLYSGTSPEAARDAAFLACQVSIPAERLMRDTSAREIADVIDRFDFADQSTTVGTMLSAYATLARSGYDQAVPEIRSATTTLLDSDIADEEFLQRYILGVTLSMITWDDEVHTQILQRAAELARDAGALEVLDSALFSLSMAETILGNLDSAGAYASEGREIRAALGVSPDLTELYRHPELMAWHGESPHIRESIQGIAQAGEHLGCGAMVSIARIGLMILDLGQGRYTEACDLAVDLVAHDDLGVHSRVLPDLVESAVRSGRPEVAHEALATLEARAEAAGTPRALGVLVRSQALLADSDEAGALFEDAILKLGNTRGRADLARAHLLYGEWLRRAKRRTAARTQLQYALEIFEDIGAADFAERTRAELGVTGETARKRSVDTWSDLTPQEEQVARLASQGNTNKEIGARLFISARTVDYHLRKVYQKLGIGSRRDLRGIFN